MINANNEVKPFEIHNQVVHPGEYKQILIDTPKLYDWTQTHMQVNVMHGASPGPVLAVTATVHGDEIIGVEALRRLSKRKELHDICGTLITVPIVNMFGFSAQSRYLPDRRDLNRFFPGSENGSIATRLANIIMTQVLPHATHLIDLHTGAINRFNLPQIRGDMSDENIKKMAEAFNPQVILDHTVLGGSLRAAAAKNGIPAILYEAGEALRFDDVCIKIAEEGILNVMHALGMLKDHCKSERKQAPVAKENYWLRAPRSGVMVTSCKVGDTVKEGDIIATIANPLGHEEIPLKVPVSGIVIGNTNLPLVHAGTAVFHIATFEKLSEVQRHLENVQMEFDAGRENQF